MAMKQNRNRCTYICAAAAVLLISLLLPLPEGLTLAGKHALGLLMACVILWASKALPLIMTSILGMIAMPYLGIMPFPEIWPAFGNMVLFFVLASFGISAALLKTHIPHRIIHFVLSKCKGKSNRIVFGFCAATALVSSVVSDIPSVVIFAEVGASLLSLAGIRKEDNSRFAKALMIAIPAGSLLGGTATPAGNSINLLVINGLEEYFNIEITFLDWARVGVPFAIVAVTLTSFILSKVFKPEPLPESAIEETERKLEKIGGITKIEVKYMVIMLVIICCWVSSSWIPAFNIAAIALIGIAVMMLPGIDILTGSEYIKGVNWEVVIMVGCILALGTGIQKTGAISWLMDGVAGSTSGLPKIAIFLIISLIPCLIHVFLPLAGAIYALAFMPVMELAASAGIPLACAAFVFGIWMNNEYLLPIDTIILLSYGHGYFTSKDLFKCGIWITLMLLAVSVILPPMLM